LFMVRAGAAFMTRNGLRSLHQEFAVIRYQRRIGFLSPTDMLRNLAIRLVLACVPPTVKKQLYTHKAQPSVLVNAMIKSSLDIVIASSGLVISTQLIASGWHEEEYGTRSNAILTVARVGW